MPNSPYLDKSVQWRIKAGALETQEPDYRTLVQAILDAGLATEVVRPLSAGKEAEVYLASYKGTPLAIKAYRLFRTSHRGGRPTKVDTLGWRAAHEFDLMLMAWRAGVRVPTPARRVENMFSMRYLGDAAGPAPRLQEVDLDDPGAFLAELLEALASLAAAGVVHGDLSAFNVLVLDGHPWFIDFSEGVRVDRLGPGAPWRRLDQASEALHRGLASLQGYFRRYDLEVPVEAVGSRIHAAIEARFQRPPGA